MSWGLLLSLGVNKSSWGEFLKCCRQNSAASSYFFFPLSPLCKVWTEARLLSFTNEFSEPTKGPISLSEQLPDAFPPKPTGVEGSSANDAGRKGSWPLWKDVVECHLWLQPNYWKGSEGGHGQCSGGETHRPVGPVKGSWGRGGENLEWQDCSSLLMPASMLPRTGRSQAYRHAPLAVTRGNGGSEA